MGHGYVQGGDLMGEGCGRIGVGIGDEVKVNKEWFTLLGDNLRDGVGDMLI